MFKKAATSKSKEPSKIIREVSIEDVDTSTDAVTPYIVIKKPMTKPLPDYDEEPIIPLQTRPRKAFVSSSLEGTLNQHVRSNYL